MLSKSGEARTASLRRSEDDGAVVAAEAEAVRQRWARLPLGWCAGDEVDLGHVGSAFSNPNVGGNQPVLHRQNDGDGFDGSRSAERMARDALGRGDGGSS